MSEMTRETREELALALINSDRAMALLPPVTSRDNISNSSGYLRNADAIAPIIERLVADAIERGDHLTEAKP